MIDAETLKLDDGSEVRLIGALPPYPPAAMGRVKGSKSNNVNQITSWPLMQHARQTLEQLVVGRSVELAFGAQSKDRYGRRVAQVFVIAQTAPATSSSPAPLNGTNDGNRIWLQAELIARGLARAYALPGLDNCLTALLEHENKAIAAGTGLWGNAAYQIRDARNARNLLRHLGSYQLVAGRVVRVGRSRSRYYLNFGRNWRTDFTVAIDKKYLRDFANNGISVTDLAGQYIRVRGWVDKRNGPLIDVFNSSQIELLTEPSPSGR